MINFYIHWTNNIIIKRQTLVLIVKNVKVTWDTIKYLHCLFYSAPSFALLSKKLRRRVSVILDVKCLLVYLKLSSFYVLVMVRSLLKNLSFACGLVTMFLMWSNSRFVNYVNIFSVSLLISSSIEGISVEFWMVLFETYYGHAVITLRVLLWNTSSFFRLNAVVRSVHGGLA